MRRFKAGLVCMAVLSLALSGCGSDPVEEKSKAKPKPPVEVFWPLTGVKASSSDNVSSPALSVKIENVADARPHVGLDKADIVWEQMVEGGLTRLNVVYHSNFPELVGPMRSVRPMDPDISAPLKGVFACSGGQRPFMDATAAVVGKFINETIAGDVAIRVNDRYAPHNLFLNAKAAVENFGEGLSAPKAQIPFATGKKDKVVGSEADAKPVNGMVLNFPAHESVWTYNQQTGVFDRSDDGSPLMVKDGGQIFAKNVIVMDVQVRPSGVDPNVPETIMIGSGSAKFAVNGKLVEGTWEKQNTDSPVIFKDSKGQVVKFAPGNTWIELLPSGSGFTVN